MTEPFETRTHVIFCKLVDKVLATVRLPRGVVAEPVDAIRTAPADGVVAAASIFNHAKHRVAIDAVEDSALADENPGRVDLHGVGRSIAIFVIVGVVAQEIDGLITL